MSGIRAVLFDLGDTLWDFPNMPPAEVRLARSAEKVEALLRSWNLCDGVDCAALARAIQEADWRQTTEAYHSHLRSPHFPTLVREAAADHGVRLSAEQALELWHASNVGGEFLGRRVFPDSVPTLRSLKARGYRLGTVTNRSLGGPPFMEELRRHGMADLFETFAISCDDGWLKPAPALYRKALAELDVRPEETVMVGDSLRADVAGAQALGMIAVWKRPSRPASEESVLPDGTPIRPDYVIDHPGELLHLPLFRT
jgi:FMN phosphatase YigB (HAD superfamily)